MSLSGQDQLAKHLPFYDVISTPFAFKDYATADKIIDGDFKAWAGPELAKKNLVHLSDWEWGFRQLTNSKKPVLTPADLKGMKIDRRRHCGRSGQPLAAVGRGTFSQRRPCRHRRRDRHRR